MLHTLKAASLKVRATRLGDPPWDRGHLQVEMPVTAKPRSGLRGGRSRFVTIAERDHYDRMAWHVVWDGNHDSKAGQLRHRRCLQCDAYARMVEVLRHGRRGVQADLFCRPGDAHPPGAGQPRRFPRRCRASGKV